MKKYIYRPQKFIDARLEKYVEDYGYKELDSSIIHNPIHEVYFDTLEELKNGIAEQVYDIEFNDENEDIIYIHWYETEEGCPVGIKESDCDWKAFIEGKMALYRYSIVIDATDIYLNQNIESLEELR